MIYKMVVHLILLKCMGEIRSLYAAEGKKITIELLTPDFKRKEGALEMVVKAKPDVFNHNIETMKRLYPTVRLGSGL